MPSTPLLDLITAAELRRLAGPGAYLRGEAYAAIRRVHSLFEDGSHVTAAVRGTEEYQVHLSVASGALQHQCTCPAAAEGAFCKHCVAVAIALREGRGKGRHRGRPPRERGRTARLSRRADARVAGGAADGARAQ